MIYGRRVHESHEWVHRKGALSSQKAIDRNFQWKYTWLLTFSLVSCAFVFLGPAWYLVRENYNIFIKLADSTEPSLFEHLQREVTWLVSFLFIAGVGIMGATIFLGLKMTEAVTGPFVSLERHMKKVSRGDLRQKDFKVRQTDDFRTLTNTYAYLYKSLKAQAEQDLKWLEKITIDPNNRDAIAAWKALVATKQSQLGQTREINPMLFSESAVSSAEARGQRRVS